MDLDIEIENFRSIRNSHVILKPGLNVLIGPNGSGKSNVLNAFLFLRDVIENGAALAMGRAGGALRNYYRGKKEIIFKARAEYGNCLFDRKRTKFEFLWELRIATRGSDQIPAISYEEFVVYAIHGNDKKTIALRAQLLRPEGKPSLFTTHIIEEIRLGKDFFTQPHGKPYQMRKAQLFEDAKKGITDVINRAKKEHDKAFLLSLVTLKPSVWEFVDKLRSLDEYNVNPEAARRATDQVPEPRMQNDGSGVSEVIHALKTRNFRRLFASRHYYFEQRRPYVSLGAGGYYYYVNFEHSHNLRLDYKKLQRDDNPLDKVIHHLSAAVNLIDDLDTDIESTTGRRYVVFKSDEHRFYPKEVSDGTMKWLCLLIAIFVPYSTTFLLEEPENFMHPWMQQRLVEIMRDQSKSSNLIFLVTSHSASILNALHPEEILLVERKQNGTEISRLHNAEYISGFLKKSKFGLGDYWVSGGIGGVPSGGA